MKNNFSKFKNMFKSNFAKSIVIITGGTVFAQGLNILLSPVITRIYTPEEYGILTVYGSILGIISLIGALSYDSAIPIADDEEKAINVLSLSILVLIVISILLSLILFIMGDSLLRIFDAVSLSKYKYLISVGFFATGLYGILSKWALRRRNFSIISNNSPKYK